MSEVKDKSKPALSLPPATAADKSKDDKSKDKGELFDKEQFPGFIQEEFDRYWGTLSAEKTKYLGKLALKDSFDIKIHQANPILDDPDADLPLSESAAVSDMVTTKNFKVYDATTSQWQVMQNLRGELAAAEQLARDKVLNSPKGGVPEAEMVELRKSVNEKDARCYYYQFKVFLRGSKDEFNRGDRTQIRDACDACSHRTIISVPNSARQSNPSYT